MAVLPLPGIVVPNLGLTGRDRSKTGRDRLRRLRTNPAASVLLCVVIKHLVSRYHLRRSAIMTGGVDVVGLAGGHAAVGVGADGAGEHLGGAVNAETTGVSG